MSLYDQGLTSLISDAMFNQIKTLLHLEKRGTGLAKGNSLMFNSVGSGSEMFSVFVSVVVLLTM